MFSINGPYYANPNHIFSQRTTVTRPLINSAPPVSGLLVGVEIDGGDGEAQVQLVSEGPGVEVGPM